MTDFEHYSKATIVSLTAEYVFHGIQGEPAVIVAPSTEENPAYMNYILKNSRAHLRQIESGNLTVDLIKQLRSRDLDLFPKFILKGFKDSVVDAEGNSVPFSKEAAADFLSALPNHEFDGLREFVGKITNFVEYDTVDPEELAKN